VEVGLTRSDGPIPRTTKAQRWTRSAPQANIGGYKAALLAAMYLPKFFPMLNAAAGTIRPAKALVNRRRRRRPAAIATCRRLGAV